MPDMPAFDPVDLVVEYDRRGEMTLLICHVEACTWRQQLPTHVVEAYAHMHVHGVHSKYVGAISPRVKTAEDGLRQTVKLEERVKAEWSGEKAEEGGDEN